MKYGKFVLVFCLLLAIILPELTAQMQDKKDVQKIILNGKEYYLHVIQRGEGLYRISLEYGVSMQEILDANDDISESLKVGQILRIPVISGRNTTAEERGKTREYIYHTVERGQTAFYISRRYNVSLEDIYRLNPGTENGLVNGAVLRIPTVAAPQASTPRAISEPQHTANNNYIYHVVKPQETLFGLSRQYGTTVEKIVEENPALRSGILGVGTEIRIPRASVDAAVATRSADAPLLQNDQYVYHSIQPGQTFFSISRQYQVDVNDLRAANPGVSQDDLKVGYMLRVPRPDVSQQKVTRPVSEAGMFTNHRVRRRETLFGISRQYHVDAEIIRKVNPNVNFQELRNGTILRIPTDAWFAARTADALSRGVADADYGTVVTDDALFGDCGRNTRLGYKEPVKVALMLPFGARESNRYFASGADTLRASSEVRVAAGRSKDFAEFYSGVLLALDTLKRKGISIDLSVYDIAPDSESVRRALSDPSLKESHLIIGPAFAQELPQVSAFSRENQIPMVFPLSNTNPELRSNPYLFHVNTPDSLLHSRMADEVVRQAAGGNLIVILPPADEVQANRFVQVIKQKASQGGGVSGRIHYVEYRPKGDDLVEIQALINSNMANYIVVPSVRTAEASKVIPILFGVRERTRADISLFGMADWLRFATIDPEQIHALNTTIFRAFGLDYSLPETNRFIQKYRSWYHTEPHAVSPYFHRSDASSGFSRYGVWGYDVASFFISAIVEYGRDFDICLANFKHDQVQFNFDFQRISNWGGFYNQGIYMIRFKPDFRTERVPLR